MKKNIYLFLLVTFLALKMTPGLCTVHHVTTSGFTFTPDSISIDLGDTVLFTLSSIHSAKEVSQATWLINDSASNGGFNVPFGGGMTVPGQVQTYYYVCGHHYFMGMKGRIFVNSTTGIKAPVNAIEGMEIFPNPASWFAAVKTNLPAGKENQFRIFNILGNCVYQENNIPSTGYLNLTGLPSGVYFVQVKSEEMLLEKKLVITR